MIIAALLVLCFVLSACRETIDPGSDSSSDDTTLSADASTVITEDTENPYDEEGYLKDKLPESLNFDEKVSVLAWKTGRNEYTVDMTTDDVVNDALFTRHASVCERLGVEIEYNIIAGDNAARNQFVQVAEAAMDAGSTCEYDLIACYTWVSGMLAQRGRLLDLYSVDYLDTTNPWYPESMIKNSEISEKLYFVSGDISNSYIYSLSGLVVNTDMVKSLGLEDPRQLVLDKKWTFDKMLEMSAAAYRDENGNGESDVGDRFGFATYNLVETDKFLAASGIQMTTWDANGNIVLSDDFKGEKMVNIIDKVGTWINTDKAVFNDTKNAYNTIKSGNALFGSVGIGTLFGFTDIDWIYGFMPVPMMTEDTGNYYSNVGFTYTNWCIPINAADPDMSGAVIEALSSNSHRNTIPALYEVVVKSRLSNDPIDMQMFDIVKNNVYVDMARTFAGNFTWAQSAVALFRNTVNENNKSWTARIKANESYINNVFADISESFKNQ